MKFFDALRRSLSRGCSPRQHAPDRGRVRHDGADFRTYCVRCGAPLVRYGKDDWRPAAPEMPPAL